MKSEEGRVKREEGRGRGKRKGKEERGKRKEERGKNMHYVTVLSLEMLDETFFLASKLIVDL